MLVTDLAFQDMEQGSRSLLGGLCRIIGRLRRHQPAISSRAGIGTRGRFPGSSGGKGQAAILPLASAKAPPLFEASVRLPSPSVPAGPPARSNVPPLEASFKWRRHPQLRNRGRKSDDRSVHDLNRDAKAAALRGLFLARGDRPVEARSAFAQAAVDPSIDLTDLAGFWQLSRSAMLIAAVAYEDVERFRDAAALSARVRTRYRPRALTPAGGLPRRGTPGGNR